MANQVWLNPPSSSGLMKVLATCVLIELALVLLDLTVNWMQWSDSRAIRRLFNITREDGLASLFAVLQTALVAVVVWLAYFFARHNQDKSSRRLGWLILALFFSYMVVDDGAMVHERVGAAISSANQDLSLPSYTWQFVFAPVFAGIGLYMAWFLWQERDIPTKRIYLFLAFACLGTAVLLDFIEGMDAGYQSFVQFSGWQEKTITHFSKSLEEFLEMLGMSFFLIYFLDFLAKLSEKTSISISGGKIVFTDLKDAV